MTSEEQVLTVYPKAYSFYSNLGGGVCITVPQNGRIAGGRLSGYFGSRDEAWEDAASRLPTPVEPKAQVESASVEPVEQQSCEFCNEPIWNSDGVWSHYGGYPDHAAEPKEVESGGLPPEVEFPELVEASIPADPEAWEHEGRLVTNRSYRQWIISKDDFDEYSQGMKDVVEERERQLKASLLRDKEQKELLRECYRILTTDSTGKEHDEVIQKLFKAAVTGE